MGKALVINTNNEFSVENLDTLEKLQSTVKGYIEGIYLPSVRCAGLVNEEGKLQNMPFNLIGTALYSLAHQGNVDILKYFRKNEVPINLLTDVIVGNMIVQGDYDGNGEVYDVPDNIINFVKMISNYIQTGEGLEDIKVTFQGIKK